MPSIVVTATRRVVRPERALRLPRWVYSAAVGVLHQQRKWSLRRPRSAV